MALVEINVDVMRVAPVNGAVYVVDGADVFVEKADGTAVAVWQDQAGTIPATLPLKSSNGRVNGWVESELLLRYRAVHGSLNPAVVWEYFVSGGTPGPAGPAGPAGAQGPAGTGAQGPAGTAGSSFVYRGAWRSTDTYIANEVVTHAGLSWVAVSGSTGSEPTAASTVWDETNIKGEQGIAGDPKVIQDEGVALVQRATLDFRGDGVRAIDNGAKTVVTVTGSAYDVKSPEFGPGAIYNHGAIGDGATHPLSDYFTTLAAAQAVYPHAVALTDQLDWAASQKAMDAVPAAGGRVHHPRGSYRMDGRSYAVKNRTLNTGDGEGATLIKWTTDSGLGQYAVTTLSNGQDLAPSFWNMTLSGPRAGFLPTVGTRECGMDGIKTHNWVTMWKCQVTGFGSNIVIQGNHQKFFSVRSTRGFFSVLFDNTDNAVNLGDQGFYGCTFDWAGWANVGIYGNNAIIDSHWSSTHLGFSPYGIHKFDVLDAAGLPTTAALAGGGAVASTRPGIAGATFDKVQFESQGNGCFLDTSTGTGNGSTSLSGVVFRDCFHSWESGLNLKIASRPQNYAIEARVMRSVTVDGGSTGSFLKGAIAAYHFPTGNLVLRNVTPVQNLISPTSGVTENARLETVGAVAGLYIAGGDIAVGDIVEANTGGYRAVRFAGSNPVLGVAAHAAALNERVLVYTRGDCHVLSEVVDLGGRYLVPFGGSTGHRAKMLVSFRNHVTQAAQDTGPVGASFYPAFAISKTSGGAAGGALLAVTLLGPAGNFDPALIRPQHVTTLPAASSLYRGVMMRRQGAAGVADTLQICEKNASDAYVWRTL